MKKLEQYRKPAACKKSPTSTFTLSKRMKKRWLDALRSGKYKQGRYALYDDDKNSFCCLGVLCAELGVPLSHVKNFSMPSAAGLFVNVRFEFTGVAAAEIEEKYYKNFTDLAGMNDVGISFAVIADFVEKYVPTHD